MRIKLGVSPDIDRDTMGSAIDAALEATTVAQVPLIAAGRVPDIRDAISAGKVKWKPEPPGDEHFDDARTVLVRGWGDCDDLAPWHAAGLRASGEDPEARAVVYQSGPRRWHAVVERSDGNIDDPSQWAGMRKRNTNGVVGIGAAIWPPMFPGNLALATYPFQGGYAGRVDIPDTVWPVHWSALSAGHTPAHAISGAIRGARHVAECVGQPHPEHLARLCGIDNLVCGLNEDEVVGMLGEDYVGILPLAIPAAGALLSSGGGGGPLGGILNMAGGLLGGGQKPPPVPAAAPGMPMGGGSSTMVPGVYIVRF